MIRIDRGKKPVFFESDDVELAKEKLEDFYSSKKRSQKRYEFPFIKLIDNNLKPIVSGTFHNKCGYCEIKIDPFLGGVIDRFRPHNGVRDQEEYFKDLYWWLAYNWENLIYSCITCSQYKASYFPIRGERAVNRRKSLKKELPLIINPCIDDPMKYFFYDDKGNIQSKEDEGNQTIKLLRLNRSDLIGSRSVARDEIIKIVETIVQKGKDSLLVKELEYLQNILSLEDPTIDFLSFKRWVLLKELDKTPFLGQILGIEDSPKNLDWTEEFEDSDENEVTNKDFVKSDYFPIEYIEIENFKSISKMRIDFKEDSIEKQSWLFLLGENGVGKSSILQAFAIGLKNNLTNDEILNYSLIQKRKQKATIKIKERNSDNIIETIIKRKGRIIEQHGFFDSFLLGYGSLRLSSSEVSIKSRKDLDKVSYSNLFNPILALNDITQWLKRIYKKDKPLFDRVAYAIKNLLPHDYVDNELTIEKGKIAFNNSDVLFTELSDGFKSTIVLAVDIMMKLTSANSDFDKVSGIVIIDELGNQLHPRWQMRIVKQLRLVFPKLNFIVSTHHPLCLRGAEENEILLLKNVDNEVVVIKELPDPSSLRVDQVLASEFFGLSSLIDPELEAKFNRYYELLAKETTTKKENLEIDNLKDELRNRKQLGATLREELMYHVIDKLLATKVSYDNEEIKRQELKDEVVQRVNNIWENLKLDEDDKG